MEDDNMALLKTVTIAAALVLGATSLAMAQAEGESGPDGQVATSAAATNNPQKPTRAHDTTTKRKIYMSARGEAPSDQYPTLNTAQVCHGITEQSDLEAGLRAENFDQCMKEEQAVRDTMIKEWAAFSSDDKSHCVAESTMGGESSYTELLTCLEMARDVRELHKNANSLSEQNIPQAPVGHRQPMSR
jgi:hypothetical protein